MQSKEKEPTCLPHSPHSPNPSPLAPQMPKVLPPHPQYSKSGAHQSGSPRTAIGNGFLFEAPSGVCTSRVPPEGVCGAGGIQHLQFRRGRPKAVPKGEVRPVNLYTSAKVYIRAGVHMEEGREEAYGEAGGRGDEGSGHTPARAPRAPRAHAHAHSHARTRTHTHTHIHTHTHTRTHTRARTHTHTHTHTHMHSERAMKSVQPLGPKSVCPSRWGKGNETQGHEG
jgi:hypothetical protein